MSKVERLVFVTCVFGVAFILGITCPFYNNTIKTKKPLKPDYLIEIKDNISDTTYIYKRP